MAERPRIIRIDQHDPRVVAAAEAEQRFFKHYGLDFKTHFVELKQPDVRVRVLEVGSGEPVLMVPGGAGDAFWFAPLIAELKGWRFLVVNRPGGGMSDGVDHRQVDLRRFAVSTLSSVMDALDLTRVPVISNSMGGLWTFWLALDQPERVSMMVQMGCPALILNTSAPLFMRLMSVPGINRFIVSMMQLGSPAKALSGLRQMGTKQEAIDAMPGEGAEAGYRMWNLPTYRNTWLTLMQSVATLRGGKPQLQLSDEQLRRIEQSVLFIWGDNDPFGGLDVARQATEAVPKAKLHQMSAGHLPFLDNPPECARVIREFLSSPGYPG